MGIPKFFQWLAKTRPYSYSVRWTRDGHRDYYRPNVLAIDGNGILHPIVQRIMKKYRDEILIDEGEGKFSVDEKTLLKYVSTSSQSLTDRVTKTVREIRPTDTLIFTIDGVAPVAKINQQRKRRYVSDMEARPGILNQSKKQRLFDTNAISPGTDFMMEVDAFLRKFFQDIIDGTLPESQYYPPNVVYSSHLVPGEGEHVIADLLRNIALPRVAVMGSDADLLMIYLPLVAKFEDIYVLREPRENIPILVESYISLKELARILQQTFRSANPERDFVALLLLNGNDFLPRFTSLELPPESLTTLVGAYQTFLNESKTPDGLASETGIQWNVFSAFLNYFAHKQEVKLLNEWGLNQNPYSKIIKESDMQSKYRFRVFGSAGSQYMFDLNRFKRDWYQFAISTYPPGDPKSYIPEQEDIQDLLLKYVEGINWVWNYYNRGQSFVNVSWYYPYHYPPLTEDVSKFIQETLPMTWIIPTSIELTTPVSPLEQLVMIIPPGSVKVVPEIIRPLFNTLSPIADLIPSDFRVDDTGKLPGFDQETKAFYNYQKIALLPFAEPKRASMSVDYLNLPQDIMNKYQPVKILFLTKEDAFRSRAGLPVYSVRKQKGPMTKRSRSRGAPGRSRIPTRGRERSKSTGAPLRKPSGRFPSRR